MGGRKLTEQVGVTPMNDPHQPQSYLEVKVAGRDEQEMDVSDRGWI